MYRSKKYKDDHYLCTVPTVTHLHSFKCFSFKTLISLIAGCPPVPDSPQIPGIDCSVASLCLGFECCVDLDFQIIQRSVKAYVIADICNYQILVGFGEWLVDISVFTYEWGTEKTYNLGNAINVRYG